jgi:steroid delta-isomerase-like uncharacterized protein
MSTEQNKAIVRRFIEGLNWGKLAIADELLTATYVDHSTPKQGLGPEGFKQGISVYRSAFPDLNWTIEDSIAEGDKVVIRVTARGTHQGDLMGISPTGKQIAISAIAIYRLVDGKIAEAWVNRDIMGMLQQVGAIPMPG